MVFWNRGRIWIIGGAVFWNRVGILDHRRYSGTDEVFGSKVVFWTRGSDLEQMWYFGTELEPKLLTQPRQQLTFIMYCTLVRDY